MTVTTISAQQVQKLREKTGAGFMDCKKALETSNGDIDKAIQFLREKGKTSAAQKAGRSAKQGAICSWIEASKGSLVELNCETDFVAKTDPFTSLALKLAQLAAQQQIQSVEKLLTQIVPGTKDTVDSFLKEKIGQLGENLVVKRVAALGGAGSLVGNYVHAPFEKAQECGTLGVLIELKADKDIAEVKTLSKELSMQIAAASPKWIKKEDVSPQIIEKEVEIYKEQCKQMGKPEKAWDKIIESKLADFYKQFCLLEQPYIRDAKQTIRTYISSVAEKAAVSNLTVLNFVRFKVGEE